MQSYSFVSLIFKIMTTFAGSDRTTKNWKNEYQISLMFKWASLHVECQAIAGGWYRIVRLCNEWFSPTAFARFLSPAGSESVSGESRRWQKRAAGRGETNGWWVIRLCVTSRRRAAWAWWGLHCVARAAKGSCCGRGGGPIRTGVQLVKCCWMETPVDWRDCTHFGLKKMLN